MLEHVKPGGLMIGYIHGGKVDDIFLQCSHNFRDLDDSNLKLRNSYSSARGPFHEANRNKIVDYAQYVRRKDGVLQYLLMIDTDIEWDPIVPYSLLNVANDADRRIISALYFGKPGHIQQWVQVWYKLDQKQHLIIEPTLDGDPLQPLDGCGMGCCLFHMSVFDEFPETKHDWRWFGRDPWLVEDQDGERLEHMGEDLTFSLRVNRLCTPGFEPWTNMPPQKIQIWGHRGVVVKHHKEATIGLDEFLAQGNVGRLRAPENEAAEPEGPRLLGRPSNGGPESGLRTRRIIRP